MRDSSAGIQFVAGRVMRLGSWVLIALAGAAAAAACDAGRFGGTPSIEGAPPVATGSAAPASDPPAVCDASRTAAGASSLRRMTDVQLANTVRDLFGAVDPGAAFPITSPGKEYSTYASAGA